MLEEQGHVPEAGIATLTARPRGGDTDNNARATIPVEDLRPGACRPREGPLSIKYQSAARTGTKPTEPADPEERVV